jgi:hypothetical protein
MHTQNMRKHDKVEKKKGEQMGQIGGKHFISLGQFNNFFLQFSTKIDGFLSFTPPP